MPKGIDQVQPRAEELELGPLERRPGLPSPITGDIAALYTL